MNEALFQKLTTSLRQAKAIRAGTLQPSRRTVLTKEHPAAVRTRLGKTQEEFADMIGVPLGTLRNWEQGHREPTGPAKALLIAAAKYPEEIADALGGATRELKAAAGRVASNIRRNAGRHLIKSARSSGRGSITLHERNGRVRVRDRQPAGSH
jgi:putative transcriptional regulator